MLKLYTMSKKNIYFCTHFVFSFVFIIREILQSVHTPYVIIDLNFENGKAFCSSYIKSEDNDSSISGNLVLSKMTDTGAQAVKTWSFSSRGKILDVVKSTAVTRGKYRLVLSATVTSNGKRDPIMRTVYANY